jgi:hypothetical protein
MKHILDNIATACFTAGDADIKPNARPPFG